MCGTHLVKGGFYRAIRIVAAELTSPFFDPKNLKIFSFNPNLEQLMTYIVEGLYFMKKFFKWAAIIGSILACIPIAISIYFLKNVDQMREKIWDIPANEWNPSIKPDIELGKRIVTVRNGCVECHGQNLGGSTFIDDPAMGLFSGSNISSYKFKDWTDGEVMRAIRHGIGKDNRTLIFMPSHEFSNLSQSDLQSVVAYLKSTVPIESEDIPISLGPLFYVLVGLGQLPHGLAAEAVDHQKIFSDKPEESPTPQFGEYLVKSACIGCHQADLSGGPIKGGPPDWPPAKNIKGSIGLVNWSFEDFKKALQEGINPAGEIIRLPMPIQLTRHLNDTELAAIWAYLRSL